MENESVLTPFNVLIDVLTPFEKVESIVYRHDTKFKAHLPEGFEAINVAKVVLPLGVSYKIDKVMKEGTEVASVLTWKNVSDKEYGTGSEAYESFAQAYSSMSLGVVGEDFLKKFLFDE